MSDLKSKLPDVNELGKMASKLFADIKKSVNEAIDDFKKKREEIEKEATKEDKETSKKEDN